MGGGQLPAKIDLHHYVGATVIALVHVFDITYLIFLCRQQILEAHQSGSWSKQEGLRDYGCQLR